VRREVAVFGDTFRQLGLAAFAGLFVTAAPLALGIAFAVRPNERWLSLMRPLTLSGIFAAVANLSAALANTFIALARVASTEPVSQRLSVMLGEVAVVVFISFVFLSTAWLCVAIGMRRQISS
jgi:hypothetical protein